MKRRERTAKELARERFDWMERLAASHYSPFVRLVGIRLAMHKNDTNGRCFVAYETLADEVNGEPRSVMRAIGLLKRDGWISIKPGGGSGYANAYRLLPPPKKTVTDESLFRKRCRK